MRDFIERRLSEPSLDAAAIAQTFGTSRATIFRDFEEYAGVAHYIKNRRLERAFTDLAENAPTRGAVTRISERWGFPSVNQFSRAFRDRFGFAPGSIVGIHVQGERADYCGKAPKLEGVDGDPGSLELWLSHQGAL